MRWIVPLSAALLLGAGLCGCGANTPRDSDPPPGVRKNEHRSTGGAGKGKSLPTLKKERAP